MQIYTVQLLKFIAELVFSWCYVMLQLLLSYRLHMN